MAKQRIGNIRGGMTSNVEALRDGGAAALGTLILGGSKAEAALNGVGQALASKVMGPLGKLVGITAMATRGIFAMTKAWATMGTGAAAKLETVQNQLRVILKGLDAAKARVRELRDFSIKTPFKMADIVQGNRALEGLTRGALTTKSAMTLVGDAAAQAGVNFEDMAVYVGRLYDGLAAGRPVGEVLFRLAELGVISGTARNAIEQLQESGAGFSEVWRVVEGELKRGSGTMDYTSKTLEGLQSTLEDTQEELKATFSANFMEGQKQAIEAQIQALENLKPVVSGLGSAYGGFVSVLGTFQSRLVAVVTSIPGVATGLEFLGRMAGVAMLGITALASATGLANLSGMLLKLVGASTLAGRALSLLGKVATGLAAGLMKLVSGPLGLLVAALATGAVLWGQYRDRVAAAAEAVREYEGATDALLSKLEAQRASIKSLDQLSAAYAETLGKLASAYREMDAAEVAMNTLQRLGDSDGAEQERSRMLMAQRRVELLKKEAAELDRINRGGLEKDSFYMQNMGLMKGNQRAEEKAALEAWRSGMSPEERAASFQAEADELARRRGAALNENQALEDARQKKAGIGARLAQNQAQQADLEVQRRRTFEQGGSIKPYLEVLKALEALKKEEQALILEEVRLAEATGGTVAAMQAKLALIARYEQAAAAVAAAEQKLQEAQAGPESEEKARIIEEQMKQLEELRRQLEPLKGAFQALGLDPAKAQEIREEMERRKREIGGDLTNRPEEIAARQRAEEERLALNKERAAAAGDLSATLAGEDGGAMAAAQEQLRLERERLELLLAYKEIDQQVYEDRMKALDAEERLMERRKTMAQAENAAGVAASQLGLQAKMLRLSGGSEDQARKLEEQAIRQQEDAGREARMRELMDQTGMSEEEARAQVNQEITTARNSRALDQEGGLLAALMGRGMVVDNLQRIGGGGGVSSGPGIKDVVARLDELIKATREGREIDLRL